MLRSVLIGAALLLLAGPGWGQPASTFAESLDVSVVNVEVFIKEKSGAPAEGLKAKDFQVWEDDQKVEITHFSELGETGLPGSLVVFLDDTHMHVGDRDPVLDELGAWIGERLRRGGTQAMVARYDGIARVVLGFTEDPELFGEAIAELKSRPPQPSESMLLERTMRDQLTTGGELSSVQQAYRSYGEVLKRDTENSLRALRIFAASLGAREGGSALLLIADGLAVSPLGQFITEMQKRSGATGGSQYASGQDASQPVQFRTRNVDQTAPDTGDTSGLGVQSKLQRDTQDVQTYEAFTSVAAQANSSHARIFAIRPPSVEAASAQLGNRSASQEQSLTDFREGLLMLSDQTAGEAFVTGRDIPAFLDRISQNRSAGYSLAFVPEAHPEGSDHRIRVKEKAKGRKLDMQYRESYVTKGAASLLAERTLAAITLDWNENHHALEFRMDNVAPQDDGTFGVTFMVTFGIADLMLLEEAGAHHANCQLVLVAQTASGAILPPQIIDIPLQIPVDQVDSAREQRFAARLNILLPGGANQVAAGLWDAAGQSGSFISKSIGLDG